MKRSTEVEERVSIPVGLFLVNHRLLSSVFDVLERPWEEVVRAIGYQISTGRDFFLGVLLDDDK